MAMYISQDVTHNHASSGGKHPDEEEEKRRERDWTRNLLGWLTFAEISDRREQVREAHQKTCRWVFEDDHDTGFTKWLSSGRGIFWIYGKPGSGKSTLMKFIAEEPRLKTLLEGWVSGNPLVVSSFWFWALGTQLQRSLVGLYRTLLYQMLTSDKSLCRISFPEWQEKFGYQDPTLEMLTGAMKKVLANTTAAPCFFLMIDGLDEYEADSIGKAGLADLVQNMARSSMVKLLVSSRPEGPFQHCFRQSPKLRLESLTRPDIARYVEGELRSNPSVRNISDAEKATVSEIAEDIIAGANGVFLWVLLVLRIAINSINSYDDLGDLRRRIMLLPSELNDLFTHIMIRRISDHHRPEASRYLLVALELHSIRHPGRPFETFNITNTLVAIAQQASSYEKACYFANISTKEIDKSTINFKGHLEIRCHGLPEVKTSLLREADRCFDVHTAIMAGITCHARQMSANEVVDKYASLAKAFIDQNIQAEQTTKKHRFELVTLFDRTLTSRLSSTGKIEHWSSQLVDQRLRSESDALACVIYAGSSLYLQEAVIRKHISNVRIRISTLLHFAVPPPATRPHPRILGRTMTGFPDSMQLLFSSSMAQTPASG